MADLARRQVAVIAAADAPSAIAAKANTTIPIVFVRSDPVKLGLVASLNRPGGNVTGVSFLSPALGDKAAWAPARLLPGSRAHCRARRSSNWPITEPFVSDVRAAASAIGKQIEILYASTARDIDTVFADSCAKAGRCSLGQSRPVFLQPSRTTCHTGDAPCDACDLSLA